MTALAVSTAVLSVLTASAAAASRHRAEHAPSTPVLALGAGYTSPHGSAPVRALQVRLAHSGYAPGPVDGLFGPRTERAVVRFQADHGLVVDGIAGRVTQSALEHPTLYPGAGYASNGSAAVRVLQRRLAARGLYPAAIDGLYGPLTERGVKRLQTEQRLAPTGIATPATLALLRTGERHAGPTHRRAHVPSVRRPRHRVRPPVVRTPAPPARPSTVTQPHASHGSGISGTAALIAVAVLLAFMPLALFAYRQRRRGVGQALRISPAPRPPTLRHDEAAATALGTATTRGATAPTHERADEIADPDGAFRLGALLQARGDLDGAKLAYRRADINGHPRGPSNLGVLLEGEGDVAGAEAAYRRADERGDPFGAFNLGVLLEEQHNLEEARAAYQRAWDRGHGGAAANLGVLLEATGQAERAESAYRGADALGDAHGAFNLGVLLEGRGDIDGAATAYARAERRGAPAVSQTARSARLALGRQQPEDAGDGTRSSPSEATSSRKTDGSGLE